MHKVSWLIVFLIVAGVVAFSASSPKGAMRTLALEGITEIALGGFAFFGCNGKGIWRTGFTGVSIDGDLVSGAVCADFTSSTIVYN